MTSTAQAPAGTLTIQKISPNSVGTVCLEAKFPGMRKAQEFIVYPLKSGEPAEKLTIQSDTRIGTITLADGAVRIAGPFTSGAYFHHLGLAKDLGKLTSEDLFLLKAQVMTTAGGNSGSVVTVDNAGALEVFEQAQ